MKHIGKFLTSKVFLAFVSIVLSFLMVWQELHLDTSTPLLNIASYVLITTTIVAFGSEAVRTFISKGDVHAPKWSWQNVLTWYYGAVLGMALAYAVHYI